MRLPFFVVGCRDEGPAQAPLTTVEGPYTAVLTLLADLLRPIRGHFA
jgi:hypothetical protein